MLKLYHTPLSINSRRVWVALIEKELPFEAVEMDLASGEQFKPEFLAMNPYHHIPVLVDGETTVIESFAILDYLEAKYPNPPLLPQSAEALATVRMIQMITVNELMPALSPFTKQMMGFGEASAEEIEAAKQKADVSLKFAADKLGQQPFFGGDTLSIGDIVMGTVASWFPGLGIDLSAYPSLQTWLNSLMARGSWQTTQPTPEAITALRERMKARMAQPQG